MVTVPALRGACGAGCVLVALGMRLASAVGDDHTRAAEQIAAVL